MESTSKERKCFILVQKLFLHPLITILEIPFENLKFIDLRCIWVLYAVINDVSPLEFSLF